MIHATILFLHGRLAYVHAELTWRGITDAIQPSKYLWHKWKIDHINVVESEVIEIAV